MKSGIHEDALTDRFFGICRLLTISAMGCGFNRSSRSRFICRASAIVEEIVRCNHAEIIS